MLSVRGTFANGVARPDEPVSGQDGQPVIITFVDGSPGHEPPNAFDQDWDALVQLIEQSAVDTGIPDLAAQHGHYVHGTPKQD